VVTAGGVKSMLFGGEGLFFARLRGPGQGVDPVAALRAARRPDAGGGGQPGGQNRGEGSILGGLGDLKSTAHRRRRTGQAIQSPSQSLLGAFP
jgi:hypothetical protein